MDAHKIFILLLLVLGLALPQNYDVVVDRFSFDFGQQQTPDLYHTEGASVRLKNRVKLMPPVANRYGGVFLDQMFRTSSFAIDVVFKINSHFSVSDGFVFWFMKEAPQFDISSNRIHAIKEETKGLSVWLHKKDNVKWRLFAHYDNGGQKMEASNILPDNSCTLLLDPTQVPVKIRIEKKGSNFNLSVVDDSADGQEWRSCVKFHNPDLTYQGYFGFTAGNLYNIVNDIDIYKITVYDLADNSIYLGNKREAYGDAARTEAKTHEYPEKAQDILHRQKQINKDGYEVKEIKLDNSDTTEHKLLTVWENIRLQNIDIEEVAKSHYEEIKQRDPSTLTLTKDNIPALAEHIKYSKDSVEYVGQNLHKLNETLNYITENENPAQGSTGESQNAADSALDALEQEIESLSRKIGELERGVDSQRSRIEAADSTIAQKAQSAQESMKQTIKQIREDPGTYKKVTTDDSSHYGILFFCVVIMGGMWYINKKVQESRKKHIL